MHVRISNVGWQVLNNRQLAANVVRTIMERMNDLKTTQPVPVEGENAVVQMVTDFKEVTAEPQQKSK